MVRSAFLTGALLLAAACTPGDGKRDAEPASTKPSGPPPPLVFDPANLRPGAMVGELRVDSTDVVWGEGVGEWVGSVRFAGEIRLSGTVVPHLVYPDQPVICFEADSASGRRLPRWPGDERRPWFCFDDADGARRMLGAPDSTRSRTIVVDRFTTVRAFTDAVNSARLVAAE